MLKIKEYKYKSFPRFNDHVSSCKGHANFMMDCEFEKEEDRSLMISVLERLTTQLDKELKNA